MSTFKGTLVVAGMFAVAGLGCSHYRSAKTHEPSNPPAQSSTSSSTTVTTPQPGAQGTEMGTGGAGMQTQGTPDRDHQGQVIQNDSSSINQSTPAQPDQNLSTQPGTGGSGLDTSKPGLDVKNPDLKPQDCNRNQIGSPSSSDVICDDKNQQPGTGGSGMSTDMKQSGDLNSDLKSTTGSSTDLKSSSGTGGAGLDQGNSSTTTTTETKKTVKHKKHAKKTDKDNSGTGGSGVNDASKSNTEDSYKDPSKDTTNPDINSDLNNSDQDKQKLP